MKNKFNTSLGWNISKLGTLCTLQAGGTPSRTILSYWKDGRIKWISARHINEDKIQSWEYISHQGLDNSSAKVSNPGDLILVTRVSVGKVLFCEEHFAVNQDLTIIRKSSKINNKFLFFILKLLLNQLISSAQGLSIKGIERSALENLPIPCPPIEEQRRIVEVLECWDKGIELVKKLIEQKELQKKYLMQQLLSGTRRFKGFTQKWETARISEIKDIIIEKGHSLTKQEVIPGNIPVIAGGQTVPFFHNKWTHNFPCITISASGAYAGYVWKHTQKIYASDCNVLYSNNYNLDFLYYVLKYNQNYLYYIQTGGAQGHIYASEIGHISIPFINAREQQAIAEVLSSADKEIDLLKQKLAKLEAQKKGLMQVLLTGKIRLK